MGLADEYMKALDLHKLYGKCRKTKSINNIFYKHIALFVC